jgi:hypothetical protein
MWTYYIDDGVLLHDGVKIGVGYSGHPPYVNESTAQAIRGEGPLPAGFWTFGEAVEHETLGWAIPLTPNIGTFTYGRDGFWCHGDEIAHPGEELASDGCMIMSLTIRRLINSDQDKALQVKEGRCPQS